MIRPEMPITGGRSTQGTVVSGAARDGPMNSERETADLITSDLATIVYCSISAMKGTTAEVQEGLFDLLAKARVKNAELGITGALLYNGSHFAQVLEGPRQALDAMIASIRADVRNENLTVAIDRKLPQRDFPDWSMAFAAKSDDPPASAAMEAVLTGSPVAGEEVLQVLKRLIVKEDDWLL